MAENGREEERKQCKQPGRWGETRIGQTTEERTTKERVEEGGKSVSLPLLSTTQHHQQESAMALSLYYGSHFG